MQAEHHVSCKQNSRPQHEGKKRGTITSFFQGGHSDQTLALPSVPRFGLYFPSSEGLACECLH